MDKWYLNAVYYELYLRAFSDSNSDGYGDFTGLRDKLEYLEWLGVDCIWITPFYPSPLRDDGYDISSFYGVDPMYGLMEDFQMTIDEIHRRGMKVIIDLVVNHTSDLHPWFLEARRSMDSPMRNYYVWSDDPNRYAETRIIFLDTEESNWSYDPATNQYYWHRFYSTQPDLNYDNPRVRDELLRMCDFWLEMGIDGFRMDAVPYLIEREGTNCENLPETHDILKLVRRFIDEKYPGRILLAEANQWPQDLLPYFGSGDDEFHLCFHFPVMPRLYKALALADRTSVIEIMAATPEIPEGCQWATFLRNHDELTLEMVTEEDRQFMWDHYAPEPRQRLNLGIRRRLASLMGNDRQRIELMYSMLFTLPGTPVLYYGDEIGMGDNITLEDRNGVRTPMQWDDGPNGGFSAAPLENLYAPPINDPGYSYNIVNVKAQREEPTSLLNTIRSLVHTRKNYPVLARGALHWREDLPKAALCFWREDRFGRFLALHNLSDQEMTIPLDDGPLASVLGNGEVISQEGQQSVRLPAYGYHWMVPIGADS